MLCVLLMVVKYCRCLYMGVVVAGRVVGGRCVVVAVCAVGVVVGVCVRCCYPCCNRCVVWIVNVVGY